MQIYNGSIYDNNIIILYNYDCDTNALTRTHTLHHRRTVNVNEQ